MNNCYVRIDSYSSSSIELPCYPDEISDNTNANWSEEAIVGRSFPIAAYTGTGYRSISFSFTMHREMASNIENVIQTLRKTVYPKYVSSGLTPPITTFRFGEFYVRGIVRSISFTWKKPIINRKYQVCDVSVSIDEIPSSVVGATDLRSSLNPMNVS